mmetsp:Transcript_33160/g.78345  ORF Transcript_33160/g.78345 Transcript_33160/m.78345 type:complete len:357 (+) Transcript_33160:984-2054(+)
MFSTVFVLLVLNHGISQDLSHALVRGTKASRDPSKFLRCECFSHFVVEFNQLLEFGLHAIRIRVGDLRLVRDQRVLKRIQLPGGNLQQVVLKLFGQDPDLRVRCDHQERQALHVLFSKRVQQTRSRTEQRKQMPERGGSAKESHRQSNTILERPFVVRQECSFGGLSPAAPHSQKYLVVGNGLETTLDYAAPNDVIGLAHVVVVHHSQFGQRHECFFSSIDEIASFINIELGLGRISRRPTPRLASFCGLIFRLVILETGHCKHTSCRIVRCGAVCAHLDSSTRQQGRRREKAVVRKVTGCSLVGVVTSRAVVWCNIVSLGPIFFAVSRGPRRLEPFQKACPFGILNRFYGSALIH